MEQEADQLAKLLTAEIKEIIHLIEAERLDSAYNFNLIFDQLRVIEGLLRQSTIPVPETLLLLDNAAQQVASLPIQ